MKVIPAIDVLGGDVVRLRRGSYAAVTRYVDQPAAQAASFATQGAPWVHVVDLDAARTGTPTAGLWETISTVQASVQAGGGVRTPATARHLLDMGIRRVVLGTAAVADHGRLEDIVEAAGAEAVVVGLDVLDGRVRGSGWTDAGVPLASVIDRLLAVGVVRVIVTGIEADGTMRGPNRRLVARVRAAAPSLAVIASGGVGSLSDIATLATDGWEAVIVGRALYEGVFTYPQAVQTAETNSG